MPIRIASKLLTSAIRSHSQCVVLFQKTYASSMARLKNSLYGCMGVWVWESRLLHPYTHTPILPHTHTPPLRLLIRRQRHRAGVHDAADLAAARAFRALAVVLFLIAQVDRVALVVFDGDFEAERLELVDQDPEALRNAGGHDCVALH